MLDIVAMRKLGSGEHVPPAQDSPAGHARPHIPQFALSRETSTHVPIAPQRVSPAEHIGKHMPEKHVRSAVHALPQRPQFALSLRTSVHAGPH